MHARAAARIVALTCKYESQVTLSHQLNQANGDSLLKLLTLNAPKGSLVTIDAKGSDSAQLLEKLQALFEDGFGE